MPFEFQKAPLGGLWVITPKRFKDGRGCFEECYHSEVFKQNGITKSFVQDNQSISQQGTIRGLHFQNPPHAQGKLVRAVTGCILDVAVDIREKSKTYGDHYSIELSQENGIMLYIEEGFAHGFAVLSNEAIVHYKTTSFYAPQSEGGIIWNDPDLGIDWRTPNPCLSQKDTHLPLLKDLSRTHSR